MEKTRTFRLNRLVSVIAVGVVGLTTMIGISAGPASAERIGERCLVRGSKSVDPSIPVKLICGGTEENPVWAPDLSGPIAAQPTRPPEGGTPVIGESCATSGQLGMAEATVAECKNGAWRARARTTPPRTRDSCLRGNWIASKETTTVFLTQVAGFPAGQVTLQEGELRMGFNGNRWVYSAPNFYVIGPLQGGNRMHVILQFFNDGDYGTRGGKIEFRNVISQLNSVKSGAEKDGSILWVEDGRTTTTPLPDGGVPYRCTRSTLTVTMRTFSGNVNLVLRKA